MLHTRHYLLLHENLFLQVARFYRILAKLDLHEKLWSTNGKGGLIKVKFLTTAEKIYYN